MRDVHDVIVIVSNTGLRGGELRDLRWKDVDLAKCNIFVGHAMSRGRVVPFGSKTLRIFESRREEQSETEFVLGCFPEKTMFRVTRQLRELAKALGVDRISCAVLRHTCANRLMRSGASVQSLMAILGWSSPFTRMKSLISDDQRYALAALDQARIEE
jgi:integrase